MAAPQQVDENFLAFLQNPPANNDAYLAQQAGITPKRKAQSPWMTMAPGGGATQAQNPVTTPSGSPVNIGKPPAASPTETPLAVDDAAYRDLVDRINSKQIDSINSQAGGIQSLEQALAKMKGEEPGVDLSALTALSDNWFGGNLSKGVTKPKTKSEMDAEARDLELAIQRQRGGLAQNEIDLLQTQLGSEERRLTSQERLADKKEARQMADEANKLKRQELWAWRDIQEKDRLSKQDQKERLDLINTKEANRIQGVTELNDALREYEKVVDEVGIEPVGTAAARLEQAYTGLTTAYKNAEDLGALAGADMELVRGNVGNAGGIINFFKTEGTKGGVPGIKAQIAGVRQRAKNVFDRNYKVVDSAFPNAGVAPVKDRMKKDFESSTMSASRPTTVVQGGHTYTLNPTTGEYE